VTRLYQQSRNFFTPHRGPGALPGALLGALLLAGLPSPARADGAGYANLPDLGNPADLALTPEIERRFYRVMLRQISSQLEHDQETVYYLRKIGNSLVRGSRRNPEDFTFVVIKDERINAFAAPGGLVGINTGIFLHAESEHELAAVLAHEIAHVTQKHMARAFEKQGSLRLKSFGALLGGILLSAYDPQLGQAAITLSQAGALQSQINFTRANEEEADRIGMQVLASSGYNPGGMPGFFGRLLQASRGLQSIVPEFLRTHPLTEKRVAEAQNLAQGYSWNRRLPDPDFPLIKVRLQLAAQPGADQAVQFFQDRLEAADSVPEAELDPLRYGYALALFQAGRPEPARQQMAALLARDEGRLGYLLAAGRMALADGRKREGMALLERARTAFPDHPQPVLEQARGLLEGGDPYKAQRLLRDYGRFRAQPGIQYYELLAQAEAGAGYSVEAALALAEVDYLKGQTENAIRRLQGVLEQGGIGNYQQQRLEARLRELLVERELEKRAKL